MPRVVPFYAVKCNDDMAVLRTLAELGAGFDCASKAELRRVMQLGVESSRIIYANPCKQTSMIRYARDAHVDLMTFDNADELYKVNIDIDRDQQVANTNER
jgi:ornithine decarboxylase